jgi:ATP phosphoribosyltransferase
MVDVQALAAGNRTDTASLVVALPKGRLLDEARDCLERAGYGLRDGNNGRHLVLPSASPHVRYVLAKPSDVPVYVEYGACDLGIAGLDVLREAQRDLLEPLLLPFGHCRLSVAGPAGRADRPLRLEPNPRVATKFPRLTEAFFRARGVSAEIIELSGSVELAPLVDLADLIVDLVQSGQTLRDNGLAELRVILESQAVLVANRAAWRLKVEAVGAFVASLRRTLEE